MDPLTVGVTIFGIAISAAVATAVPFITHWLAKRAKKDQALPITYSVCVVVLGLSRSGKTTFIRQITGDQAADPNLRTVAVRRHSTTVGLPDRPGEACTLSVVDYDGTDLGLLTSELGNAQFGLANATALVVIVDAVEPEPAVGYSQTRVDEHLSEWSANSLAGIIGMFPHIRYSCLYVNKVDLLDGTHDLQQAFDPLLTRIRAKVQGPVELRCGSFAEGRFVPAMKSEILQTKVRNREPV